MLDDLKYIHERDAQDALGAAEGQCEQLLQTFELPQPDFTPENIVFGAMGGSALAANLSQNWPGYTVPFEIVRGYDLPTYVSPKTLFIAASYSGNTEETLSALAQAEAKGAHIMVIAGGGKLVEIAQAKGYPLAQLPKMPVSRYTTFVNLKAIVSLLEGCNVLAAANSLQELESKVNFVRTATAIWRPDIATKDNPAKSLAQELMGRSVVIYSGPKLAPAAYRWKISINENAKQIAWVNQIPEFSHNEFSGWSRQPIEKPYAVIDLRSAFEHPQVQKRFVLSERFLSGMRPAPIVIQQEGDTLLEQLLWSTVLGDFVGIYLGLLNGVDPTPLELVDKLKDALTAPMPTEE
jgi:glucose/mannose-6-phosphate isomerase